MNPYTPITFLISACNCPLCGAYAQTGWYTAKLYKIPGGSFNDDLDDIIFSGCNHCFKHTIWLKEKMIYPLTGSTPLPNPDLPSEIQDDYEEARSIVELSPRGAVALLRLALQKLCIELGEKGKHLDTDIKNLVAKGLPEKIQKALDSVRVIGNNAVHPGVIDLKDDRQMAYKLFGFINVIAEIMITQPRQIDEFYDLKIPSGAKEAISKRDGSKQ